MPPLCRSRRHVRPCSPILFLSALVSSPISSRLYWHLPFRYQQWQVPMATPRKVVELKYISMATNMIRLSIILKCMKCTWSKSLPQSRTLKTLHVKKIVTPIRAICSLLKLSPSLLAKYSILKGNVMMTPNPKIIQAIKILRNNLSSFGISKRFRSRTNLDDFSVLAFRFGMQK